MSYIEQYKRIQAVLGTTVDGAPGPNDDMAYRTLKQNVLNERAHARPVVSSRLGEAIVAAAKSQIGVYEVTSNQAPAISKYWAATNYPEGMQNREPWCAAFVCWCVAEGVRNTKPTIWQLPRTARAFGMDEEWAKENKLVVHSNPSVPIMNPGDVIVFRFSHTGIYVGPAGLPGEILTIEGNTNGSGSREGDGVYQKTRSLNLVRSAISIA
jgi:hypothetical protein